MVGVSGHRDLLPSDLPAIRIVVRRELERLQTLAGGTDLILLSALAIGADQIVAEEAMSMGWCVIAVLPMPLLDYMDDFKSESERDGLRAMLDRCAERYELPWAERLDADIAGPRDQQYRNQGAFVVRQSQVVMVLWDGLPQGTGGCGTAFVASLCLNGPPAVDGEILAAPERIGMVHVPVCRLKAGSCQKGKASNVGALEFPEVFGAIGSLNSDMKEVATADSAEVEQSLGWIMAADRREEIDLGSRWLLHRYAEVDALARGFQKKRKRVIQAASAATVVAALCQATYGVLHQQSWIIAYGVAIALAYALYLLSFRLPFFRIEIRYLEYRALAEALRVQFFWRLSGLTTNVADHYLQLVKSNVGWVREVARNMTFIAQLREPVPPVRHDMVRICWLQDQVAYFVGNDPAVVAGNTQKRRQGQSRADIVASITMGIGVVLAIAGALAHIVPGLSSMKDVAAAYSASFFLITGVVKGFALSMGYNEEAITFEKAGGIFRTALVHTDKNIDNDEGLRECAFVLGKYALAESADWLLLHRRNAFKLPSVGGH